MKKTLKKYLGLLLGLLAIFSTTVNVFAQEPVYVTVNNLPLNYEDAKPQIMNQRAMVPIRKTAENLGATIEWNKNTETMTIKKGDRVVVHTMRSKIITINGKAATFDTPSAVVKDRMMMPVRMLSEALGNRVEWNNSTRTVNIIADKPIVVNASVDKTTVNSGEKVIITVNATSTTERVKVLDVNENKNLVAEGTTYTTNSDGTRHFSIPWTPSVSKNVFQTLKIVPGNLSSYNEENDAYKICSVSIMSNLKGKIIEAKVDKAEVGRGDSVKLTVYADNSTEKIKISSDLSQNLTEIVNYTISDGKRVFETTLRMEQRGEIQLKIYAGGASGYNDTYVTIKVNVSGAGTADSVKKNAKLTIHDVFVVEDVIYTGEKANIRLFTSSDITRIEVFDENDKPVDKINYPTIKNDNNNEYIWDILLPIYQSGRNRFNITAYNKDNEKVRENLSLSGTSYSKSDLHIIRIEQRDTSAIVGDTVKFIIKTTSAAEKLKIMNGTKEEQTITNYSSEGDFKVWEFRIKITDSNKDQLKVVAYKGSETVTRKLSSYVTSVEKAKIFDVELKTPEVYLNEYVRVTIYTNKSVSKVWVEDASGLTVGRAKTTYDRKSGEEYEWDFRIPAEEVGTRVLYTVYAQNENGTKVDESFRVKVTK